MYEARWELVNWKYSYADKQWEQTLYAVHIFKDGEYTGVGTFCNNMTEVEKFAKDCNCGSIVKMEGELR